MTPERPPRSRHRSRTIAVATHPLTARAAAPQAVTLDVQNMTCPVCLITVKKSLQGVSGVSEVSVDFAKKTPRVSFDPDKTKPADLMAATANAGYPSTVRK